MKTRTQLTLKELLEHCKYISFLTKLHATAKLIRPILSIRIYLNENPNCSNSGYMAPEYAMQGLFSIKTDVFSFGVILLEIISGRKNSGFYLTEHAQTLLGYVCFFSPFLSCYK